MNLKQFHHEIIWWDNSITNHALPEKSRLMNITEPPGRQRWWIGWKNRNLDSWAMTTPTKYPSEYAALERIREFVKGLER